MEFCQSEKVGTLDIGISVFERQAAEIYARCVRIKQFYCHDENQIKMYWPVVMNGRAKRFDCKRTERSLHCGYRSRNY